MGTNQHGAGDGDMAAIFRAMAEFYYALYIIDIKDDGFTVVRGTLATAEAIKGCASYSEAAEKFIETFVFPDDMNTARRFTSTRYLASVLSPASPYCRVEARQGRADHYEWVAVVFKAIEFDGGKASKAVLGVENIDGMRSSMLFDEQLRMQNFARKLTADTERKIRSMTEKTNDERSAMLLRLSAQGRLLYMALRKTDTQAFEYDPAADRLSTILEWDGECETMTYSGGAGLIAEQHRCSEKDTLAIENAFGRAAEGFDAQADFVSEMDGGRRYKRLSLYVMRAKDIPTGLIVGVVSDVTNEKLIADQAEREREFRNTVLGNSAYGIEIYLEKNRWKYLWQNCEAGAVSESDDYDGDILYSMARDVVAREDYSEYISAMNRQTLLEAFRDGRSELSVDYRVRSDAGELLWSRNIIHLLADPQTGEAMADVYSSDINAQKLKELEEERTNAALAERASAEKRANELKSRFLANMSHELRTPLGTMLGMSQLALREDMPDRARGYVREIKSAGTGLLGILNGILDLARIETGGMEAAENEYRPQELLNDIAGMFEYQAAEKSLSFNIELAPELPSVLAGDDGHLREVLVNLVSNAIKFTDDGGVTVAIGLSGIEDGFARITAAVSDTGSGIRAERLEAMLDEYDAPSGSSQGLGLSISRQLVSLMGGELRARSEFGRGSRFYFELRQRICDKTPGGAFCRRARELPDERQYWNFSAPDATILLVDDDSVNLRVVLGLLRPYGMRVITASGGDEALRILKKEKADLVLMDQMMPEMDGVETTRHIRAMGAEYERLPVLALTANAMKGAREELLAGGMDDYISKPIEMRELSEKLRRWLPEEKLAGPAEMPQTDDGREDLPQIEGIDAEKGLSYMNTFSDYMMCLRDFRSIIPEKAARLEALAEKGDMKEYTAEVHGLKSSARLIGADTLADMAARLEKSGRSGLTDDVRSGTAKLLTAYRAFFDRLEPYASGEAENNETGFELTESEYAACLRELRQYVDRYDCDSADHWSEKMRLARVPESCAASLAGLHRYILAAQFSACAGYIDELLEGLRQA